MTCGLVVLLVASSVHLGSASSVYLDSPLDCGSSEDKVEQKRGKCYIVRATGAMEEIQDQECCSGLLSKRRRCGQSPTLKEGTCFDDDWQRDVDMDCCDDMDLHIRFDVMGDLGSESTQLQERLQRAKAWILHATLRAMLDDEHFMDVGSSAGVKPKKIEGRVFPILASKKGKEFDDIDRASGSDHRSRLDRTVFKYTMWKITAGWSSIFAKRLCMAYNTDGMELATAVIRALELEGLSPHQAMDRIVSDSSSLLDVRSAVVMVVSVAHKTLNGKLTLKHVAECEEVKPRRNAAGGFFFAADCPPLTAFCNEKTKEGMPVVCTDDEANQENLCKCAPGYTGSFTIQQDSQAHETSPCQLMQNFCKVPDQMQCVKCDYMDPKGTLGELIEAKCDLGFESDRQVRCIANPTRGGGFYEEIPRCKRTLLFQPMKPACKLEPGKQFDITQPSGHFCDCSPRWLVEAASSCSCVVRCAEGYTDQTEESDPPYKPTCELQDHYSKCPSTVHWDIRTRKCSNATSDEEVHRFCCDEAWFQNYNKDRDLPPSELQKKACSSIDDISECYGSQDESTGEPCCWQHGGWGTSGKPCLPLPEMAEGATAMETAAECAVKFKVPAAVWRGLPECEINQQQGQPQTQPNPAWDTPPKCAEPRNEHGFLEVTDCDSCAWGEDCACQVHCAIGNTWLPGSGPVGGFLCKPDGSWSDDFPICRPFCWKPGDQGGTLDTTGCVDGCYPGQRRPCDCTLQCEAELSPSAGIEGDYECVLEMGNDEVPAAARWVTKNAGCEWKSDPASENSIGDVCMKNSYELDCNPLTNGYVYYSDDTYVFNSDSGDVMQGVCKEGFLQHSSVVATSKKTCKCKEGAVVGLPVCISSLVLEVVDSKTDSPIPFAKVAVYSDDDWNIIHTISKTDKIGRLIMNNDMTLLRVKVEADFFSSATQTIHRDVVCENPRKECQLKISMMRVPADGIELLVDDDHGCHISSPESGKISIDVVLMWGEYPQDLDLWIGPFDCSLDAQIRYNCGIGSSVEDDDFDSAYGPQCRRSDFYDQQFPRGDSDSVNTVEQTACNTWGIHTKVNGNGRRARNADKATAAFHNQPVFYYNLFHKWVHTWNKEVDNLHKRVLGRAKYRGTTDTPLWSKLFKDQTCDAGKQPGTRVLFPKSEGSSIKLDVDCMKGYGPETATFSNVPPGRFQIVVNSWSQAENIYEARPRVTIRLGSAQFECAMKKECAEEIAARLWYVADILVGEQSADSGQNGNFVRAVKILDQRRSMEVLTRQTLPSLPWGTIVKPGRSNAEGQARWKWKYAKTPALGDNTPGSWPPQEKLESICYGMCEPQEQTTGPLTHNFRRCLDRDFWPIGHTIRGTPVAYARNANTFVYLVKYYHDVIGHMESGDEVRIFAQAWNANTFKVQFSESETGDFRITAEVDMKKRELFIFFDGSSVVTNIPLKRDTSPVRLGFKLAGDRMQFTLGGKLVGSTPAMQDLEVERIEVESLVQVQFEYVPKYVVDKKSQVKQCTKTCERDDFSGVQGNVVCWPGGEKESISDLSKCFTKYIQPGSKRAMCWSQQLVGPGVQCCDR